MLKYFLLLSLYSSLNPNSVSEQLAYYELYPKTQEGKQALMRTFKLLGGKADSLSLTSLQNIASESFLSFVNRSSFAPLSALSKEEMIAICQLASHLGNRALKGNLCVSEEEVLALPAEEIDLARGLLLSQGQTLDSILQYEAALDLMALQIQAKLPQKSTPEEMIEVMNDFIFNELHFRFPPNSEYAPDIDQYTFLPSVLETRRGVCLGVSLLYLCLAQRLRLPLEIVTPPGHIFVRYRTSEKTINIETTARGASTPTELYLGINTKALQQRNIKESIGLAYFNQAAVFSRRKEYAKAVACYEKALCYMGGDPLLTELLGFHLLFLGRKKEAVAYLEKIKDKPLPGAIAAETTAQDFLLGRVDAAGIEALFTHVEDNQTSILAKQKLIEKTLAKYPTFREGLLQLATCWMQLARTKEALAALQAYHKLDPDNPDVEFELAALYAERFDFNKAWGSLRHAEKLTASHDHFPKGIKTLKEQLLAICPEPSYNFPD